MCKLTNTKRKKTPRLTDPGGHLFYPCRVDLGRPAFTVTQERYLMAQPVRTSDVVGIKNPLVTTVTLHLSIFHTKREKKQTGMSDVKETDRV